MAEIFAKLVVGLVVAAVLIQGAALFKPLLGLYFVAAILLGLAIKRKKYRF